MINRLIKKAALAVAVFSVSGLLVTEAGAFADLGSCDVINLRANPELRQQIGIEAFAGYEKALQAAFEKQPDVGAFARLSEDIIVAQHRLLSHAASRIDSADYLSGPVCQLLESLGQVGERVLEGDGVNPNSVLAVHRKRAAELVATARVQQEDILRRARFRPEALALFNAKYACFAASIAVELIRPKGETSVGLEAFGATRSCRALGRSSLEWTLLR